MKLLIWHFQLAIFLAVLILAPLPTLMDSVYFNYLCENTELVVFKKTPELSNTHEPCVCFDEGWYEFYKDDINCIRNTIDNHFKTNLPYPTQFFIPVKTCVGIPQHIRSIRKLPGTLPPVEDNHYSNFFSSCILSRQKRQDPPPAAPPADPAAAAPPAAAAAPAAPSPPGVDTEFVANHTPVGHPIMREQIDIYIESVVNLFTSLHGEDGDSERKERRKYPAIKLLEFAKQIMQRTCQTISTEFFDLAINSFINLQLEVYLAKEPFISYHAYKRIETSLSRCLTRAQPHTFVTNNTLGRLTDEELWDDHLPTAATNQTVQHAGTPEEKVVDIVIPPFASSFLGGETKIAEPLIETVWKMFVSMHSYCYSYFNDYYNDHHTLTVVLLPLFTNKIQELWLKGGEGYDISGNNKLYGGLLGDTAKLMTDVDLCVGASRVGSAYPWFMNRPTMEKAAGNTTRRRKREVDFESFESESLNNDVDAGINLSSEFELLYECRDWTNAECVK